MGDEGAAAAAMTRITDDELARVWALAERAAGRVRAALAGWRVAGEGVVDVPQWAIVNKADAWRPDLIFVGSHGRSALARVLLGSVSQSVLTHAACSVRISRRRPDRAPGPIRLLIGVDGSVASATAVSAVAMRYWPAGTEARILAAVESIDPPDGSASRAHPQAAPSPPAQSTHAHSLPAWASHAVQGVAEELTAAGLIVSTVIREGDPKQLLTDEADRWPADCIVLGAKGMSRLDRFLLGSVSLAVAGRARCSVEVVRHPA